ncbi:MAG: translocation/assembly module TamB domain-containing protein [Blastocatellia bacterium]|nr:translocation/assembly module TamB domain-containing protein [Blastocatellia bacterium]
MFGKSKKQTESSWSKRRKILVFGFLGLFIASLATVISIYFYIRSDNFNRYVASEIERSLAKYGLYAKVGDFSFTFSTQSARLHNLEVVNQKTGKKIATLNHLTVNVEVDDPYALKLERKVVVKEIKIDGLQLELEIDKNGSTNLDGIHQPPSSDPSNIKIDLSKLVAIVSNSQVTFNDRSRNILLKINKLQTKAKVISEDLALSIQLESIGSQFAYDSREVSLDSIAVNTSIRKQLVELKSLKIVSPLIKTDISGSLNGQKDYRLSTAAQISLEEVSRLFLPSLKMKGNIDFQGLGQGEFTNIEISGEATGKNLNIDRVNISNLKASGLQIKPTLEDVSVIAKQTTIDSLTLPSVVLKSILLDSLKSSIVGKSLKANAERVQLASIDIPRGKLSQIKLSEVESAFQGSNYSAKALLQLGNGEISGVKLGEVKGKLDSSNQATSLTEFTASLLNGVARGEVRIADISTLKAEFNQFDISNILALLPSTNEQVLKKVSGKIDGKVDLNWPGIKFSSLNGKIDSTVGASAGSVDETIPVTGTIAIVSEQGTLNLDQLLLRTDNSKLTANGHFALRGESDIGFRLESSKAQELQALASSVEEVKTAFESSKIKIGKEFIFDGNLTGKIAAPSLEGSLTVGNVRMNSQALGSLDGKLKLLPTELKFDGGLKESESAVSFALTLPFDDRETGEVNFELTQLKTDTVLRALAITNNSLIGEVSGSGKLSGLSTKNTDFLNKLRAEAKLTFLNATIAGQKAGDNQVELFLEDRILKLQKLDISLPQGRITAEAVFDIAKNSFQIDGRAENVDLRRLATTLNLTEVRVKGKVTASFKASGDIDRPDQLQLDLNVEGQGVTINGRSAGELKLTACTDPQGKLAVDLVTGITGKPQPLKATIDLQSPQRYVEVEAALADVELVPLIALFSPDYAETIAGKVTGQVKLSGPTADRNGETRLDQLHGSLLLQSLKLKVAGSDLNVSVPVNLSLNGNQINLEQTRFYGQGFDFSLGLELKDFISQQKELEIDGIVSGVVDLDKLAFVEQLGSDTFLSGKLSLNTRFLGSVSKPQLSGDVKISDIAYSAIDSPVSIENGQGRITISEENIILEKFTARVSDGELKVTGGIKLADLRPKEWKFDLKAEQMAIFYRGVQAAVNASLFLTGNSQGQEIFGTVTIPQAEYVSSFDLGTLLADQGTGITGFDDFTPLAQSSSARAFLPPVKLNVKVQAQDSFLVRNEQINTVAAALLTVGGTLRQPEITGRVSLEGGTVNFRKQRYDITNGTLDLSAGGSALLNFAAEGKISDYQVQVGFNGPIDNVELILRSEPDLPRSEILSLITTGRIDTGNFNTEEAINSGVNTAASLLSQQLLSKPAEQLLGVSNFQLDPVIRPNANPAARLTVGRRITRDLQLTYSTNLASEQDQTGIVDYNLSNRFSSIISYTQGGNSTRGGRRDGEIIVEIRGRERFALGYKQPVVFSQTRSILTKFERPPLPKIDVELDKPEDLKIGDRKKRQLLPVAKDGYSLPLARIGERNLLTYLQEQGYFFANVRYRCEAGDCASGTGRLVYEVDPGEQFKVKEIRVEGSSKLRKSDVIGQLQSKEAKFFGGLPIIKGIPFVGGYGRGLTSNDRLRQDREIIRRRMVDLGYRSARVDSRLAFTPEGEGPIIIFRIEEGAVSTISEVTFEGNQKIATEELKRAVAIEDEDAFSVTRLRQALQNIKEIYAQDGYLDATVELELVELAENRLRLNYKVAEGSQSFVDSIEVTGFTKSDEKAIRGFFEFAIGEILTPKKIQKTQRNLYSTGAFSEVSIRSELTDTNNPSSRRIVVNVTESKPLLLVYGLGYSSDEGPRGLLQLTNTNLFGAVNSASMQFRASRRQQLAQFRFTDPNTFGSPFSTTFSVFFDRNSNLRSFIRRRLSDGQLEGDDAGRSFGINRFAAFVQTERKLNDLASLRFRYNFENARLFNIANIPEEEIARNASAVRLGMLSAGFSHDSRDSALNPTKGQLFSADYSIAARLLGGNESFNKLFGNYQFYKTLPESLGSSVLALSARVGLAKLYRVSDRNKDGQISDSERLLPISERFFAGGANTLRGFRFEEAGPQGILLPRSTNEVTTLVPLGGDALTVFNAELRYPLTSRLRIVPFYDLGNVFRRPSDISFSRMTNTIGLGLRFNTPVGPVGIDYGFLIDPPRFAVGPNEILRQRRGVIHIRFGQTF